jgi:serine/threonine protein kinase
MSTKDQNDATVPMGALADATRLTGATNAIDDATRLSGATNAIDDATHVMEQTGTLEAAPTQPLMIDVIKGRYRVERELGRGGIGVVYLARDTQLMSRPVVIKVLLEASAQNEWFKKKFNQEMEALARLDHPGIVGVLDAGQTPDGKPYIVMQYIEGSALRDAMREGCMELGRVARIIRQVGIALTAAHEKGIYHRDLKPENIMLQHLGEDDEQAKLIDFGIATVKDSETATNRETTTVAGTAAYMAPEQLMGKPVAGSDIYALAVIAYEMVTGCRPFNPDSPYQLLGMQEAGVKVRPQELCGHLPEAAQEVILKSLAFDTADRHLRARDFGDQLARALATEGGGGPRATHPITQSDAARTASNPEAATTPMGAGRRTEREPLRGRETVQATLIASPTVANSGSVAQVTSVANRSRLYWISAALVLVVIAAVVGYTQLSRGAAAPPGPAPTPTPAPAPASVATLPLTTTEFYDEFLNLTRWTPPPAGWTITKEARLLIDNQPLLGYPTELNCADFTMSFYLRLKNAAGAAWAMRVKDTNNYYLFYLSGPDGQIPNRFLTYVVRDNKFTPPEFKNSIPINARLVAGGEYQIDIKVEKNRFFHWITPSTSGEKLRLGDYTDPENVFPTGGVGFRTVSIEQFSIDDLFVWPPGTQPQQ